MDTRVELIKIGLGSAASTLLHCLGANYRIIILLMCCMAVDTLLGWLGAVKKGEWKSRNARWGAVGKLVELIIIALMYLCEWAFAVDWLISTVTLYFLLCEGASIIENIVKYHLNDNIPESLAELLEKAKHNFVGVIIKKIKGFFEDDQDE